MGLMKALLFLCILWCSAEGQVPTEWTSEFVPDLKKDLDRCGLSESAYVCNPNKILTDDEVKSVNESIQAIVDDTYCVCPDFCSKNTSISGLIFTVLVIESVAKHSNSTVESSLKKMANEIRRKWKVGDCDNDVTMVVAVGQKKVALSSGSKILLSQLCFDRIFEKYGNLSKENVAEGIKVTLNNIRLSLKSLKCTVDMYPDRDVFENENVHNAVYKYQEMIVIIVSVVLVAIFFVGCGIMIWRTNRKEQPSYRRSRRSREDY